MAYQFGDGLKAYMDKLRVAMPIAMEEVGEDLIEEIKPVTPIKTGLLRASLLKRTIPEFDRVILELIADRDYAIYVHENLEAYHAPPTKARFISATVLEQTAKIRETIRRHLPR